MAKVDKNLYTKEEWQKIRAKRREEKTQKKLKEELQLITKERPRPTNPVAFVLGNGMSRKPIELPKLKTNGTIYACNAVYRDFEPDYLVAVDTKMILEIARTQWQNNGRVWTNYNRVYDKISNLNYFNPSKGWSSGPTALDLATRHGHTEIYILGFDFKGTDEHKVNNVFADTPNYKRSIDKETYFGNWLRQTTITIEKNPQTRYIRVIEKGGFIPPTIKQISNLEHITVPEFIKMFGLN